MTRIPAALALVALLAACGADGEPVQPRLTGKTSIGVNSNSGVYSRNSVGIEIGL